ncbi:hypothetical protein F5B18DRAFT_620811 [Nemania serpens]|nr:hypothetical protein F5B18DRAFT_620811 [Nemania serpens]
MDRTVHLKRKEQARVPRGQAGELYPGAIMGKMCSLPIIFFILALSLSSYPYDSFGFAFPLFISHRFWCFWTSILAQF